MSSSIRPRLLCLHVGVHKTATTYIQSVLERSVWIDGYSYIGPWASRENIVARESHLAGIVPDIISCDDVVVLSDENLLGTAAAGLAFYPHPERHLSWAEKLNARICLCVRNYADFLPSVWVESLRHGAFRPQVRKVRNGGFVGLLERLERLLPQAEFFVWDYAAFRSRRAEIFDRVTHSGTNGLDFDSIKDQRPSPSEGVVATYLELRSMVNETRQAEFMRRLVSNPHIQGGGRKFSGLSESEVQELTDQFSSDLEVIASRYLTVR